MIVSLDSIDKVVDETLSQFGVPCFSIEVLQHAFQYANRSGISTHGVRHLPMYVKKILSGHLNPKDEIKIVIDTAAISILDANNTFGQVAAWHALDEGIRKAKKFGVSLVGVRNSNTFGAAGYFGHEAALCGMGSLIFANAAPAIAPVGGNKPIFGTNPLCFAFPGSKNNNPIVLDMATTVVARSKIKMAEKSGLKIPLDWAVGPDGQPTDDPTVALMGSLLPIAGYKGFGLSLFIDLFAGLMTGSAYAGSVRQLTDSFHDSKNGQLFVFIDIESIMSKKELEDRVDCFYKAIKSCGNEGTVMLPGEPGYLKMAKQTDSVDLSEKEIDDVNKMASSIGIQARLKII